jgi:hypothetical protein
VKAPGIWSYDGSTNVWTLGIWKEVRLEATGPVRLDWTRVETTLDNDHTQAVVPPTPEKAGVVTVTQGTNKFSRARVHATLEVDSLSNLPVQANFCITAHNQRVTKKNFKHGLRQALALRSTTCN